MRTRLEAVDDEKAPEELSASLQGIVGCLEVGLAHLTPDQRRLWESDVQPNLLMSEGQDPGPNIYR